MVIDVLDKNEQKEIIIADHNRTQSRSRKCKINNARLFFPKMTRLVNETIVNCNFYKASYW